MDEKEIVGDDFFIKNQTSILKHLSRLGQKNIRYTATLAGLTITAELAGLLQQAASEMNRCSKLIQAEEAKETRRDLSGLKSLHSERNKLNEKSRELELCIKSLFRNIIYKRMKDIVPVTRSIRICELGRWLTKHTRLFLNDGNLRFIAYFVYDKAASVRANSLKALIPLYEDDELPRKLKLFTQKYQQRFLSLSWDKSRFNQEIAIKLVTAMFRSYPYLFTRKDLNTVSSLMFSPNRKVAIPIDNVFLKLDEDSNGAGFGVRWFRHVVTSVIELKGLNFISYLVDALVANIEIMKDWNSMIHILTEEVDDPLTPIPQPQEILIEMMFWCASLSTTSEYPTDSMVPSLKQRKQMKEEKLNITKHLMPVIAILLARFKTNVNCIIHLIRIPQYFDFENRSEMEDLHLRNLLGALQVIAQDSADAIVLDNCSKTLHCLYKRASIVADCDIWDDFLEEFQMFRNGVIERNRPIEGTRYCLLSCGTYLSWELMEVKDMDLNNMVLNAMDCMKRADVLELKLKKYIEICKDIVKNVTHDDLQQAQKHDHIPPVQLNQITNMSQSTTDVRHVSGTKNIPANLFSRVQSISSQLEFTEIAKAQKEDKELKQYLLIKTALQLKTRKIPGTNYSIYCDTPQGRERPFVPVSMRKKIFDRLHNLSHPGPGPTIKLALSLAKHPSGL
ncbi:cohesin subunit SA-1-like [Ctenocephalides felis]|uniref:cohesin subunit SA-1-like n=1 Tax=Ctenocephalides felis TaxID=7515 RepID=UPI000E6E24EB|nr:cohesin subunit SA-1-like [Ctenocephalides felis]